MSHRREMLAVVLALGLAVALRMPSLGQPLLEHNSFRQTQTAYTARLFYEDGVSFLHAKLPVLGPPFEVPMEFPLYQALATLPMHLGTTTDRALRLTSLVCFLATGIFLWGLLRRLAGGGTALASLLFFLFSPFGLVWSRTSMIEYLATAGAIGYVWVGMSWRDHPRPWLWGTAMLAGLVAMLVKVTTGLFWLLPFVAYVSGRDEQGMRGWIRVRTRPAYLALLVIPVASAVLWTRHADTIKAASPATSWLTSQALPAWMFGTLSQRLDVGSWLIIAARIEETLVNTPFLVLVPLAILAASLSRQSLWWGAVALAAVLPVAVFFNLYVVHDYYLAAITPALAAFLGLGAATIWECLSRRLYRLLLVLAGLGAAVLWGQDSRDYWSPIYLPVSDPTLALPLARELSASSRTDDLVVVTGREWSPDVLYYARRSGLGLTSVLVRPDFVGRLPNDPYRLLASFNPHEDPLWVLRAWPWTGVLSSRVYVMGSLAEDLRGAPLLATDDGDAYAAARAEGRRLVTAPLTVPCGIPDAAEIPRGTSMTWLRLRQVGVHSPARIYLASELAPLPVRSVIAVDAGLAGDSTRLRLACLGASSVTVEEVSDAPMPRSAVRRAAQGGIAS